MIPTVEEVKRVAEEFGIEYEAEYKIADSFVPYVQPATFTALPEELQAFAQHWIEVGRKEQREKDAKLIEPKNDKSDWTSEAEYADFLARMIRNNTGE